jgi:hypothetical protein
MFYNLQFLRFQREKVEIHFQNSQSLQVAINQLTQLSLDINLFMVKYF